MDMAHTLSLNRTMAIWNSGILSDPSTPPSSDVSSISEKLSNFGSSEAERTGVLIELLSFIAVGTFGNVLLLITFFYRMRQCGGSGYVYNYMIFALALGDICVLLVHAPFYLVRQYQILFNDPLCKIWQLIGAWLVSYVHLMICIAIPLERFFAVCFPLTKFDLREVYRIIGCVCIFSIPMAAIYVPYISVYSTKGKLVGCHYQSTSYIGGTIVPVVSFVSGVIPVIVALALYGVLFGKLIFIRRKYSSSAICSTKEKRSSSAEFAAKGRIALMLFGVTLVYYCCWLPYFLVLLDKIEYDNRFKVFFFFNNATNFCLYGLVNRKIRLEMIAVLRCRPTKLPRLPYHQDSSASLTFQ